MKRGFFSLRRLRWKLAFSYALVTVGVLFFLQILLLVVVFLFVGSDAIPRQLAQNLGELAPRLAPDLSRTPPDLAGVREDLRPYDDHDGVRLRAESGVLTGGGKPFYAPQFGPFSEGSVFVVDAEGRVLDAIPETEQRIVGGRLDAGRFPGMGPLLEAALGGEENPERLYARAPDGRMLAVAPVKDGGGRVVGAAAATLDLPGTAGIVRGLLASDGMGVLSVLAFLPNTFGPVVLFLLAAVFGLLTAWGLTRRLGRLARASDAWSRGDFSAKAADGSRDELGQLSRRLDDMAAELEDLVRTRGELAALEARGGFARDLHDSVKQQVYAASLQVDSIRPLVEEDSEADARLQRATGMLAEIQKELNAIIHGTRPVPLQGRDLAGALREYAAGWSRGSGVAVRVRDGREDGAEAGASAAVERALFRVAQEALANVARHSGAANAEVDLSYAAGAVTLRVADDGRGFDPARTNGGFGLRSMGERVSRLGGSCEVESSPGGGTCVLCVCPLAEPAEGRP